MDDVKHYMQRLFAGKQINVQPGRISLFEDFILDNSTRNAVQQIITIQTELMKNWTIKNRIADVIQQPMTIPNATVGKPYEAAIHQSQLQWDDVSIISLEGLEEAGLGYDKDKQLITGTPTASGDIKCVLKFTLKEETPDTNPHEKQVVIIINPDPKTLWKNLPSDKDAAFWKEDDIAIADTLGDRHFVAASKRGRSHANAGSFRDDDFAYKHIEPAGWNVIAVADGAGSALFARQGSAIACKAVVDYFTDNLTVNIDKEFQTILAAYKQDANDENQKQISQFVYQNLSKAAFYVHQQLVLAAQKAEAALKDFHTTLIFTLFKKFDSGYAFLSFGVGDCPIVLLNKNLTEVTPMNGLDVGEFGGGTRFITMPDIFQSDKFSTRFRFKLTDDFSYLIMMTDGVYDAKFVVEANLEKEENWKAFLEDMKGKNEDNTSVEFNSANSHIAGQLSTWLDFWSTGNHDDRTLAIVF